MERAVVVRGRLHGRHIELDEQVDALDGDVEVSVRAIASASVSRFVEVIAAFPAGSRSKEDIDRQIAAERAEWDRG